jgi:hypothetical protein
MHIRISQRPYFGDSSKFNAQLFVTLCIGTDFQKQIVIEYLNQLYRVSIPNAEVLLADSLEDVPIKDKVLILHYLLSAKVTPISNRLISFKELPGGDNYSRTGIPKCI